MNANSSSEAAPLADDHGMPAMMLDEDGGCADGIIQPVVRIREEHNISRRDIDPDALKVLYRLARNNYIAYLVGGGVRDLLLGRNPKDFDISTNARPEQIRGLFRNCILIGRRFRLAHVRYGDKVIETSTFRSTPKCVADPNDPEADLFQRDDNLFGSPQEDALRRDFTVNGLFYDIESFSIIDYVGGLEDLAARRIRCIGDPCIRFREDPVRMIRAVRFASRLGFVLDPETEDAIHRHGDEMAKASPARLLEEITRLFAFSSGEKAVRLLSTTGLLRVILPEVADVLDGEEDRELFWRRLAALDTGDTVLPDATPGLIFAVLLLEPLKRCLGRDWGFEDAPRLKFDKLQTFLNPLSQRLKFPRKLVDRIIHIYLNQHRFAGTGRGKRGSITGFVTQDSFHESLALAEIILTAEGGPHTRLNEWRDMLTERIYGRDDHSSGGGNGERPRRAAPAESGNGNGKEDGEATLTEGNVPSGKKLSRSARRRRNKRMNRIRSEGEGRAPEASGDRTESSETTEAVVSVASEEAAAPVEEQAASGAAKKPARTRNRRTRSRKKTETGDADVSPETGEKESNEPVKPLSAADFWNLPEPEPEPEPEKKRRPARKGRAAGKAKKSEDGDKAGEGGEVKKPPQMDRADEADIPMHWLDEI